MCRIMLYLDAVILARNLVFFPRRKILRKDLVNFSQVKTRNEFTHLISAVQFTVAKSEFKSFLFLFLIK